MTNIFTKNFIKHVNKIFKKRGYNIHDTLKRSNDLANKELEYEVVVDKLILELEKGILSEEEKNIEKQLENGWKSKEANEQVISFFEKLRITLKKIKYILYKIKKSNDEDLKVLKSLIKIILDYKDKGFRNYKPVKEFEIICKERYGSRKKVEAFILKISKSMNTLLNFIIELKKETKEFDYQNILKILKTEKNNLLQILQSEIGIYGAEISLLEYSLNLDQLRKALYKYSKDSTIGKNTRLIKRKQRIRGIRKILIASILTLHLAGIAISTIGISLPYPIPAKNKTYYSEIVQSYAHENVTFKSKDGYELPGWFFNNPNTDKTIILCHGKSANKTAEMPYVRDFIKKYNVFIFDFRHHGEDRLGTTSIGYYEVNDLWGALDHLALGGIKEVAILGHSMGGSVAIMTAAQYKSDNIEIKAIITEGAFANLNQLLNDISKKNYLPQTIMYPAKKLSEAIVGYKMKNVSPEKDIAKVKCPILIFQAYDDEVVPSDSAERLFNNAKGLKYIKYFHGNHSVYDENVSRWILEFLSSHL